MFQVPSVIEKIQTLADGGNKLSITTAELSPDEMTKLFELRNKEGWLLFKENYIKKEDIVGLSEVKLDKDEISPSKRLRNRMFVWYKETHQDTSNFNSWYINQLDKIGQQFLDKLN